MDTTDGSAKRRPVHVKRVDECGSLHDVFTHCLPAFGGAYLRRIYTILDPQSERDVRSRSRSRDP